MSCLSSQPPFQTDVKITFLHGDLHEELYMKQLEGYTILVKEHLICKLKRSLNCLKQAPRQWYKKFDAFMLKHGFKRSHANHCLYTKKNEDGNPIILILNVDDMLLAGKKRSTIVELYILNEKPWGSWAYSWYANKNG